MADDSPTPNDNKLLRFTDERGAEQACELQGEEAAHEFWAFVAEWRGDGNQVFTIEDETERVGLRFDFDQGAIARYRHFFEDDGVTLSRTFELYTLIEEEERSHALVRALIDGGFEGTHPLAAWMPFVPEVPDYADDDPETREYVLRSASGDSQRLRIRHPNDATYAREAFLVRHAGHDVSVEDPEGGERLDLMRDRMLIGRTTGLAGTAAGDGASPSSARTEFMKVDGPRRYGPAIHLFLEDGFAGLDHFGQWFTDVEDLDLPPEQLGRHRAAMFTTEADILAEIGCIWADSGIVDQSDQYWVFFDSRSLDEDEAERAELLVLLGRLGLEPVEPPAGAESGEVWVPREDRLDAEIDNWA